jgi:methylthioribose-1-phosphate isomerase
MKEPLFLFDSVALPPERDRLVILDQTQLPGREKFLELRTKEEIYEAITSLRVRGAPAIGIAAAYGLCVAMLDYRGHTPEDFYRKAERIIFYLESARPTAVNPSVTLGRLRGVILDAISSGVESSSEILDLLFDEADVIKQEDIERCRKVSEYGLSLIKPDWGILTHCNAGHLAVSRLGTALGPLYLALERNYGLRIYADETRPLLQGARLTAYELSKAGADVTLICDNMAALVMAKGLVDAVLVGCDRIAANGDVANKVGTSALSIIAAHCHIPFYVLGPSSSVDTASPDGDSIPIEERDGEEITELWFRERMAPEGIKVFNPAFDITRAEMISAIITEDGIFRYPYNFK